MRIRDWSSDVCSSDLPLRRPGLIPDPAHPAPRQRTADAFPAVPELLSRAIRSLQERLKPLPQDLPMHPPHQRGEGDLLAARLGLALERLPVALQIGRAHV